MSTSVVAKKALLFNVVCGTIVGECPMEVATVLHVASIVYGVLSMIVMFNANEFIERQPKKRRSLIFFIGRE
jgi:hypothetical protein